MSQDDWDLYKVDLHRDVTCMSVEEILSLLRNEESHAFSPYPFKPTDRPWLTVQRPRNRFVLYFKRVTSAQRHVRTEEEVGSFEVKVCHADICVVFLLFEGRRRRRSGGREGDFVSFPVFWDVFVTRRVWKIFGVRNPFRSKGRHSFCIPPLGDDVPLQFI